MWLQPKCFAASDAPRRRQINRRIASGQIACRFCNLAGKKPHVFADAKKPAQENCAGF
jgi:hypothetical protein